MKIYCKPGEPCCDGMKKALDNGIFKVGEFEGRFPYPFHFCPFCGEKIEEVGLIPITDTITTI